MVLSFSSSAVSSVLRHFQLSHVLSDDLQLLFKLFYGSFGIFGSIDCAVKIDFCHREFAGRLVVFLV